MGWIRLVFLISGSLMPNLIFAMEGFVEEGRAFEKAPHIVFTNTNPSIPFSHPRKTPKYLLPVGEYSAIEAHKFYLNSIWSSRRIPTVDPMFPQYLSYEPMRREMEEDIGVIGIEPRISFTVSDTTLESKFSGKLFEIARAFMFHRDKSPVAREVTRKWLYRATILGEREAFELLGYLWIEDAVALNEPSALYYWSKISGGEQEESEEFLKRSAQMGYPPACFELGENFQG